MKKSILTGLALALTLSLSMSVLADHKNHYKRDRIEQKKHYSDHNYHGKYQHNSRHASKRSYRHGKYYDNGHNRYRARHSYRSNDYYRGRSHYRRHHNDLYKWLAGTYIVSELLHHHNGRACYVRH